MIRTGMPKPVNQSASTRPVGPAPIINTGNRDGMDGDISICCTLADAMQQHYHHGLVLVSVVVAILASYTALTLALRLRSSSGWPARAWLLGGGFAMGTGIWAMHFVGMLALSLPVPVAYDVAITALSLLIAIAVSTFSLHIASREDLNRPRL